MKTLLYTIFFSLFGIHLLAQSNKAVCLDGKDNNLRIGMDTLCRHWTLEAWIKPDNNEWKSQEVIIGGGEYSEQFVGLSAVGDRSWTIVQCSYRIGWGRNS